MRRLSWPGRRSGDDDGAVAVLVAVLLSTGVLLGLGALVIDVGTMTVEREQLQSGADAAAWAIAARCAADVTDGDCQDPTGLATEFAGANAKDGVTAVNASTTVCTPECAAPNDRPAPCPPPPTEVAGGFAQVGTSTLNQDGTTALPRILVSPRDDPDTTRMTACSQVVWGVATQGTALGLVINKCEWNATGAEVTLDSAATCGTPAGPEFGWTGDPDCTADITVGTTVPAATGPECPGAAAAARDAGRPVVVSIMDVAGGGGYHVVGLAGFLITQYRSAPQPDDYGSLPLPGCGTDSECVVGHFTRIVVPRHDSLPGTGDNYGAAALSRIS